MARLFRYYQCACQVRVTEVGTMVMMNDVELLRKLASNSVRWPSTMWCYPIFSQPTFVDALTNVYMIKTAEEITAPMDGVMADLVAPNLGKVGTTQL